MTSSSASTAPIDIAIVGAGPGGLCAAHALANRGFSVGVFERSRTLRPIGAALGLAEQGYLRSCTILSKGLPTGQKSERKGVAII